jgi:hypothetical protein
MIVSYVQKLMRVEQNPNSSALKGPTITEIAVRSMFQFDINKILSPGIRQAAINDLNAFFDSVATGTTLPPGEQATSGDAKLMAADLRNVANMLEDGTRVLGIASFNSDDGKRTLIIEIKLPQ